jgi:hypothetical protein
VVGVSKNIHQSMKVVEVSTMGIMVWLNDGFGIGFLFGGKEIILLRAWEMIVLGGVGVLKWSSDLSECVS